VNNKTIKRVLKIGSGEDNVKEFEVLRAKSADKESSGCGIRRVFNGKMKQDQKKKKG
jgi:hypothetical protein